MFTTCHVRPGRMVPPERYDRATFPARSHVREVEGMKRRKKTPAERRAQTAKATAARLAKQAAAREAENASRAALWASLDGLPDRLPAPEPGGLTPRNLEIAEAMARTGSTAELIRKYLELTASADVERLTRLVRQWRAEGSYAVSRAVLETAKTSRNVGDRKLASELFASPEAERWAMFEARINDYRARVDELIARASDDKHAHVRDNLERLRKGETT